MRNGSPRSQDSKSTQQLDDNPGKVLKEATPEPEQLEPVVEVIEKSKPAGYTAAIKSQESQKRYHG